MDAAHGAFARENARLKSNTRMQNQTRLLKMLEFWGLLQVSVRFKHARVEKMPLNIPRQWSAGTTCVSECPPKTLACPGCVSAPLSATATRDKMCTTQLFGHGLSVELFERFQFFGSGCSPEKGLMPHSLWTDLVATCWCCFLERRRTTLLVFWGGKRRF